MLSKSMLAAVAVATLTVSAAFATVPAQTNACNYQFATNLRLGAVSSDVQNLQKLLNMDAATRVAVSGAGSMGSETFRFGPATLAAVKKFQAANGISPVSGYVGPLSRGVLNTICSSTVSTTPSTNTGSGVVSNNIPVSVLVQGQAGAKLAEFVVSGNGSVTNITLQRTGLSNNDTLTNVYLYDGMTRLTDANSVRQDGSISFNSPSGLFTVSGSKTITVRADIKSSSTSGQTVGVALTSVTMMGGTATPVTGANGPLFSISSATTATVAIANNGQTVNDNSSLNVPRTNFSIWSISPTVSTNNVVLKGLALDMIGSADASALSNIALFVDGVQVATANVSAVNGNKRVMFDLSSMPKLLATGGHTIDVRANIVSGATRDFKMSLMNTADMIVEDVTLPGIGVTPTFGTFNPGSGTQSTRIAGKQTLTGASATSVNVFKDTSYSVTNITPGASNVVIGKYKLIAYGEDTKIQTVKFNTSTNSTAGGRNVGNVTMYVNGAQVGNTLTGGLSSANTTNIFNLGSNFIAMAGVEYVIEIKANALHYSTGAVINSPETIQATIDYVDGIGQYSQAGFTNTTTVVGQSMSFGGGNYSVGNVTSGFNSTVSPNATDAKIGSFVVSAGVTEGADVRTFAFSIGGSGSATFLSNVRLVDAANGSPIAQAQGGATSMTFSPTAPFIVAAGQTRTVNLVANTGNQTALNTVIPTLTVTGYGVVSNQQLTFSNNTLAGTTVTYNSASTGAPSCSSTLNAQQVQGGSSLSSVCVLNFTSTNGGSTINDLTFTTTGTAGAIESVTINGVTVAPVGTSVSFSGINLPVPVGSSGANFPITVKYSSVYVGSGAGVLTGSTAGLTLATMKATADGQSPANTSPAISVSNTMTLRATLPSVTKVAGAGTSVSTGNALTQGKIGTIRVAADAAGDIMLGTLSYTLSAPAAITNVIIKVNGTQALDKNGVVHAACTTTSCTFTNGYRITANTNVAFDIFADVAAPGSGISGITDASVGSASAFLWSDDVTTDGSGLSATGIPSTKYQQ